MPRTFNSLSGAPVEEKRTSALELPLISTKEARRRWVVNVRVDNKWGAPKLNDLFAGHQSTSAPHLQAQEDPWTNAKASRDARRRRDVAQRKWWPLVTALASLSLAIALSVWMLPDLARPQEMKNSASPNSLRQGREVYGQVCAGCHGIDLKGAANQNSNQSPLSVLAPPSPPPLDESGHSWMHTDAELFRIVKYGIANCGAADSGSVMPGFADEIDDVALEDVIVFVKSKWPDKIKTFQDVLNKGGAVTRPSQGKMICSRLCLPAQRASPAQATAEIRAR